MIQPRLIGRSLVVACAVVASCGVAACSSDDPSSEGEPHEPDGKQQTFCTSDENTAPEWAVPWGEMGTESKFRVSIEDASPASPIAGNNTWTVKVLNAATDVPVTDARVTLKCLMPEHGHGCAHTPSMENLGDGEYRFGPIIFSMAKNWTVTFTVKGADGTTDTAVFDICI